MTTTEPTTDESATTPPANTPAPVVQEPATEPATDDTAATADTEQPEQEEQLDTEHTTEAEETDDDEHDTDPRLAKVRAEAKGLRGRLRDAEGERDTAGLRLVALQIQAATQLATGKGGLSDGADLLTETRIENLVDEDGTVDMDKLAAAVEAAVSAHPHWAWRPGSPSQRPRETGTPFYDHALQRGGLAAAMGTLRSGLATDDAPAASWQDMLRGT